MSIGFLDRNRGAPEEERPVWRTVHLRGLPWADVMTILDDPADVRDGGREKLDRAKWIVSGVADDGERIEMVCVLDVDEHGKLTDFVTMY